MPRISIIIPVYNAAQYLTQCLDSIISQEEKDYELLLIDDGSADGSRRICEKYASRNSNIHYLYKKNGGVSTARNLGLDHAQGEYICFVDADDWVEPSYLQTLISCTQQKNPADIIYFGVNFIQQEGTVESATPVPCKCEGRASAEERLYQLRYVDKHELFGFTWDKMFKADIIRQHNLRFAENISFREDELFTFSYCQFINTLQVIATPLYNYRMNSVGLTSRGMKAGEFLPSSLLLEKYLSHYEHPGIRDQIIYTTTNYRALHIFKKVPLLQIRKELKEYRLLIERLPQTSKESRVPHLTHYLQKGLWTAYLDCLIRKL